MLSSNRRLRGCKNGGIIHWKKKKEALTGSPREDQVGRIRIRPFLSEFSTFLDQRLDFVNGLKLNG